MYTNEELEYLSNRPIKKLKRDIDGLDNAVSLATEAGEKGEVIRLLIARREYIENLIRTAPMRALRERINELQEQIKAIIYEMEQVKENTQMAQWYKDSLQVSLDNLQSELRQREQELETTSRLTGVSNEC